MAGAGHFTANLFIQMSETILFSRPDCPDLIFLPSGYGLCGGDHIQKKRKKGCLDYFSTTGDDYHRGNGSLADTITKSPACQIHPAIYREGYR
jgi:hypothetical protein